MRVCAFIGHRTVKEIEKVSFAIENTVENLIASGVTEHPHIMREDCRMLKEIKK